MPKAAKAKAKSSAKAKAKGKSGPRPRAYPADVPKLAKTADGTETRINARTPPVPKVSLHCECRWGQHWEATTTTTAATLPHMCHTSNPNRACAKFVKLPGDLVYGDETEIKDFNLDTEKIEKLTGLWKVFLREFKDLDGESLSDKSARETVE